METIGLATRIFGKKITYSLTKLGGIWLLSQGVTLWTIWVERNDITFSNNNMWDFKKTKQAIWQSLFEYVRIAWDMARKDVEKAIVYDDVFGNYDKPWGGSGLLYTKTTLGLCTSILIRAPNVSFS